MNSQWGFWRLASEAQSLPLENEQKQGPGWDGTRGWDASGLGNCVHSRYWSWSRGPAECPRGWLQAAAEETLSHPRPCVEIADSDVDRSQVCVVTYRVEWRM